MSGFSSFVFSDNLEREKLLKMFPPRFSDVFAHHVTIAFGVPDLGDIPKANIAIVGYSTDGIGIEALVVSVNGTIYRDDGKIYHITWSLNKRDGYRPKDSNILIRDYGFEKLKKSININMKYEYFKFK